MGIFDFFVKWLGLKKKEVNVFVVGLDNSGKIIIINQLKLVEFKSYDIVLIIGFIVEKFLGKFLFFTVFDMLG